MARRGPKGASPDQLKARGTDAPYREVHELYPDHASRPDPDDIPPPRGMSAAARKIWKEKVDRYRQRGQKIGGFEDGLRQYCELEAALTKAWKNNTATMAMVNAHRIWAAEFYDTPASQKVTGGGGGGSKGNRFGSNGRKPG